MISLNCMALKDPKHVFSNILRVLFPKKEDAEWESLKTLKKPVIVVLDEIDSIRTADGEILYRLFETPHLYPCFGLIGIANALDLTARFLPRLKAKFIEPIVMNFLPYNAKEVIGILNSRLEMVKDIVTCQPIAVEFCSRKIAAVGDIRKALDWMIQAIEAAEIADPLIRPIKVTMPLMIKVINSSFQTSTPAFKLQGLNMQSKIALATFWKSATEAIKVQKITLDQVNQLYKEINQ